MIEIARTEGLMYTEWGPCFCPEPHGECIACKNAQRIKDAGLDCDVEFQKYQKSTEYNKGE